MEITCPVSPFPAPGAPIRCVPAAGSWTCSPPCPSNTWWDLESFLAAVRSRQPDILREGGDYDRWFIRDDARAEFYAASIPGCRWKAACCAFSLSAPNAFGMVDLGSPSPGEPLRPSACAPILKTALPERSVFPSPKENGKIAVASTGQILVAPLAPRVAHYQLARYCQWGREDERGCRYRITAASLARARAQGLNASKLPGVLESGGAAPIPPAVLNFIGTGRNSVRRRVFERQVLLRVTHAEILDELLASPAAAWLGERLNAETILVKPGREQPVLDQLARLGYLAESRLDV